MVVPSVGLGFLQSCESRRKAKDSTAEEAQKTIDDVMARDATRGFGNFWMTERLNFSFTEDDGGLYCITATTRLPMTCPPFIVVPVAMAMKSKLRPDQVDFLERKIKETSQENNS
ncbi:MAG: hypothetical protein MJ025_05095 [Victivallaceae bacterium]|nr:hypothetical protein [Victivallaceae bacterium]